MILSSATYLAFLLICVPLNHALPHRFRNLGLLLGSAAFFAYAMPAQAVVMMAYVLAVYLLSHGIGGRTGGKRKALFALSVGLSVGFLFFYKYLGFALSLFGVEGGGVTSLVVPMGISYVTFQCIAYLTEVYKGELEPEESPIDFFVYALFFAKLTAGPIEPPGAFLAGLKKRRSFSLAEAQNGLLLMAAGFLKKVVVADFLAPGVAAVFSTGGEGGGWSVVVGSLLYAVQLLYDFSGYTDIARGSALLFGVRLTENFDAPYAAVSVRDFWRRWHISLSGWLRRYVYIPLGGSRAGSVRRYGNILLTFLVSGIWHGASLTFVFWGLLHGVYQVAELLLEPVGRRLRGGEDGTLRARAYDLFARARTFLLVTVAWVFFRADSLSAAFAMLGRLFAPWGSLGEALVLCGLDGTGALLVICAAVCAAQIKGRAAPPAGARRYARHGEPELLLTCCLSAWAVALVFLVYASSGVENTFIYFDF